MTRVILLFLMPSMASTLVAQDANTNHQETTELKSQLQIEHERVQQLLEAVQQLQQQVRELQSGRTLNTPALPAAENAAKEVVGPTPAVEVSTSGAANSDQPAAICFRGITLTPGGFLDATGIYRTHNE